jgi:3-oxoacyl-[acyl-carrier protein] reductase
VPPPSPLTQPERPGAGQVDTASAMGIAARQYEPMPAQYPLEGQTALVTGAGRGLGRAYALHLAELGADVAVVDRDVRSYRDFEAEEALMTAGSTGEEVSALGRRTTEIEADVTDAAAIAAAVRQVYDEWGRLDIAVCNAGGGIGAPRESRASTMDLDQFDAVVRRNLYGTVFTCTAVAPIMKEQSRGRIITVSSRAGLAPSRDGGYAHYGTAKAAIAMYTRYLAQDLGPFGITVNCIAPGSIGTGRLMPMFEPGMDKLVRSVALRRIGTTQDCAAVVGFLAGPGAAYLTGAVIPIDGGLAT